MNYDQIELSLLINPLVTWAEVNRRRHIRDQLHHIWTRFLLEPNTKINIKFWIRSMNHLLAFYDKTAFSHPTLNKTIIFFNDNEKTDYYWFTLVVKRLHKKLRLLSQP